MSVQEVLAKTGEENFISYLNTHFAFPWIVLSPESQELTPCIAPFRRCCCEALLLPFDIKFGIKP